jgi:hypothetical protein
MTTDMTLPPPALTANRVRFDGDARSGAHVSVG